ncbi:hypothetical protein SAMN05518672_103382 [Chitinophaga sp. CF118]|nr:hypothetical protein SAMN05518672_103382 [Chitinophaga sp. CF118]
MKRLGHILTILLIGQICLGQEVLPNAKGGTQRLAELSDSLIKYEVASFTMKGNSLSQTAPQYKAQLTEVPVSICKDDMVHLSIWSTYIHLYFKGAIPDKTLDSIFLVTHSHFWVRFPKDAFDGLSQSNSCNFTSRGKRELIFSPYFKAFYSKDKRRLYIYMLGGTEYKKYEVTWVIVNSRYCFRILDEV